MKKYILKFTLIALMFVAGSCDEYLDINQDPDVLGSTDAPEIILPIAQVSLGNNLMGWDLGFGGGYWGQYWTQSYTASQFKTLCEYQETSFSNAYQGITTGTLADLKRIKLLSADPENLGYYYIAEAMSIFTWQLMTDLWGDIPYTEALRGDEGINSPIFDNSTDIYADLMTRIDALLALDPTSSTVKESFDFLYAGDLNEWVKFANSVKLKLMIRQSETSSYNYDDIGITKTTEYQGGGGLSTAYLGGSINILNNLSVGASAFATFGVVNTKITTVFDVQY